MAIHTEVLDAARRLCEERRDWRFTPDEVVRALPHIVPGSVRTHVTSRCCVNAPRHHAHKWGYFKRVKRGVYEVLPAWRRAEPVPTVAKERSPVYAVSRSARDTIHAVVTRDRDWYVAECLEVAVVTQGRTLDETVTNLREAVGLHMEGEDPAALGLVAVPRLVITHETSARGAAS